MLQRACEAPPVTVVFEPNIDTVLSSRCICIYRNKRGPSDDNHHARSESAFVLLSMNPRTPFPSAIVTACETLCTSVSEPWKTKCTWLKTCDGCPECSSECFEYVMQAKPCLLISRKSISGHHGVNSTQNSCPYQFLHTFTSDVAYTGMTTIVATPRRSSK